ncbi:hypothetical protein OS493_007102 [Desmophyllum pertusum]|uniref:TGF-beta family profile domain-containing protein n=1 Tax=Desmophyllum pertusum TaxID=174260 RepID=A0A9X0D0W4_9CNID|nr:hypothetical protein OS493_007102 [Desmophyllum pertusum]
MMMMQYLFLFLFVSASVVGKEQIEKREEPPSLEVNKTTSEPGGPKTPSFMPTFYRSLVKGNKAHGKAYFQGESPDAPEVQIRESQSERTKPDIPPKKSEHEVDACRKVDMIVHTADLGLSAKSIHPESFNAFQCKGKCSLTQRKKFITHSLIKALVKQKKGIKTDGMEACCVPTKLLPMSLMYYIEKRGAFVMRTFKDMIVEECGCY